jgi:hypothetical protein
VPVDGLTVDPEEGGVTSGRLVFDWPEGDLGTSEGRASLVDRVPPEVGAP